MIRLSMGVASRQHDRSGRGRPYLGTPGYALIGTDEANAPSGPQRPHIGPAKLRLAMQQDIDRL